MVKMPKLKYETSRTVKHANCTVPGTESTGYRQWIYGKYSVRSLSMTINCLSTCLEASHQAWQTSYDVA